MERLVDNPVKVVRQNTDVPVFSEWRIRHEIDVLARRNDSLALFGIENIGGDA